MNYRNNIIPFFHKYYGLITYFLILVGYLFGSYLDNPNISLLFTLFAFVFNVIEAVLTRKEGYLFYLLFHFSIFLFILSRPAISLINDNEWNYFSSYTINVSLFILIISLFGLNLGFSYSWNLTKRIKYRFSKIQFDINIKNKEKGIIIFLLVISLLCSYYVGLVTYQEFHGNYVGLYLGKDIDIPFIINFLSGCCPFLLIFYFSTLPSKKVVYLFITLYLLTGVPEFLIGGRNTLMIRALFCFLYIVLRELYESNKKWITKKLKIIILCSLPIAFFVLGIMNYTRENSQIPSYNPAYIVSDFFYKQGTSYDTLCQTIEYRENLRDDNYISYTLGEGIDFLTHNKLSNIIFGTKHLDNGNSLLNATISNNLAHRVSYIVLGNNYLEGHGRGTTYFSELYLDFGYLGVLLFNFCLGLLFKMIVSIFSHSLWARFLLLNCLFYLFIIPRLATFSIISFIISYYFWFTVLVLFAIHFTFKNKSN